MEVEQHSVDDKPGNKPECSFQDSLETRCHRGILSSIELGDDDPNDAIGDKTDGLGASLC
jgi:hypothetical protein